MRAVSLAGDAGYNVGQLWQLLEERNITAYIPIHPIQETNMVARGVFAFHSEPGLLAKRDPAPWLLPPAEPLLPVCSPAERLSGLPSQGCLSPAGTKAPLHRPSRCITQST